MGKRRGEMFNPYLGWMTPEQRERERKKIRRLEMLFILGMTLPLGLGLFVLFAVVIPGLVI